MSRPHLLAFLGAIAALLVLGWWASRPAETPLQLTKRVTLWTEGAAPEDPVSSNTLHASLAGNPAAPGSALRVSDAAELRRRLPYLEQIKIRGDGVDASDAAALRGLAITWEPPARELPAPAFVAISAPAHVRVGQRVTVQGAVAGMAPGGVRLTLQSPDGTLESVELKPAATALSRPFSIVSSPARTVGEFEWQLRLEPGGEIVPLGVSVQPPRTPRVLLLQASPNPELSRLQRWLIAAHCPVTTRTRVSSDRFRFSATPESLAEFSALEASVLKPFDLVVTTEAALAELRPDEQQALSLAVRDEGLGLLVLGGVDPRAVKSPLVAFRLEEFTEPAGDERRLMRMLGTDGNEFAEWITLAAPNLNSPPLARRLVQDSQGRTLVAAARTGRGWLARSTLIDTWRWEQAGHKEAFSAYWAGLLSAVARPEQATEGHWSLQTPDQLRLVHEAVNLTWHGPAGKVPTAVQIRSSERRQELTVPVTKDPSGTGFASTRYWPASPGWHYVQSELEGAVLAFHVQVADALPALRTERRRTTTAALAAAAPEVGEAAKPDSNENLHVSGSTSYPNIGYVALACFLACMTVIWYRERRS